MISKAKYLIKIAVALLLFAEPVHSNASQKERFELQTSDHVLREHNLGFSEENKYLQHIWDKSEHLEFQYAQIIVAAVRVGQAIVRVVKSGVQAGRLLARVGTKVIQKMATKAGQKMAQNLVKKLSKKIGNKLMDKIFDKVQKLGQPLGQNLTFIQQKTEASYKTALSMVAALEELKKADEQLKKSKEKGLPFKMFSLVQQFRADKLAAAAKLKDEKYVEAYLKLADDAVKDLDKITNEQLDDKEAEELIKKYDAFTIDDSTGGTSPQSTGSAQVSSSDTNNDFGNGLGFTSGTATNNNKSAAKPSKDAFNLDKWEKLSKSTKAEAEALAKTQAQLEKSFKEMDELQKILQQLPDEDSESSATESEENKTEDTTDIDKILSELDKLAQDDELDTEIKQEDYSDYNSDEDDDFLEDVPDDYDDFEKEYGDYDWWDDENTGDQEKGSAGSDSVDTGTSNKDEQ